MQELLLVGLQVFEVAHVVFVLDLVVVVPGHERLQVVVDHVGHVAGLDGPPPGQLGDLTKSVGQTLEVVTGQQLLVEVEVDLSPAFLQDSEFLTVHPERHAGVEVVVVSVKADVLGEVRQLLFLVYVVEPAGVVGADVENVVLLNNAEVRGNPLGDEEALHLDALDLGDDIGVDEVVGVDFVGSGEDDSGGVVTVLDGDAEGVDEESLVQVDAGPRGGLVEGLEVLGVVEQVVEGDGLVPALLVVDGEDGVMGEHAMPVVGQELLDGLLVLKAIGLSN